MSQTPQGFDQLFGTNLTIVTGKGGVGKTTVASALALAATNSGRRTLLVEVEGRQSFSRVFGTQAWDYEEREFRPGLWGIALDPSDAVYEYLELFYGLKRVSWVMEKTNALDFVTTAAPGLRDLLLIGKVYEIEARKRSDGRRLFDHIIVDAPPTGRIVPFLQAPEGVTDIVRMGPIKRQSGHIVEMLHNPKRTQVVLVTLYEEMPVTETVEAVNALSNVGVACGPIFANEVREQRLSKTAAAGLLKRSVEDIQRAAGIPESDAHLLLHSVEAHRERIDMQTALREELVSDSGHAVLELPLRTEATFDLTDIEVLADVIAKEIGETGPRARDVRLKAAVPSAGKAS